mgnify:CR=1 FL=1
MINFRTTGRLEIPWHIPSVIHSECFKCSLDYGNNVYFADFDMVQSEMYFIAKGDKFDPKKLAISAVFNSYFGGGMYLSPRNMLKFGQLYLCKGKLNGKRIISKKWIEKSFKKHLILENTIEKNEYGYLWWHKTYIVKGRKIKSVEARGNGGQYIFVVPELEIICVITAGNYRNGKTKQPEKIFNNYILPAIL